MCFLQKYKIFFNYWRKILNNYRETFFEKRDEKWYTNHSNFKILLEFQITINGVVFYSAQKPTITLKVDSSTFINILYFIFSTNEADHTYRILLNTWR